MSGATRRAPAYGESENPTGRAWGATPAFVVDQRFYCATSATIHPHIPASVEWSACIGPHEPAGWWQEAVRPVQGVPHAAPNSRSTCAQCTLVAAPGAVGAQQCTSDATVEAQIWAPACRVRALRCEAQQCARCAARFASGLARHRPQMQTEDEFGPNFRHGAKHSALPMAAR